MAQERRLQSAGPDPDGGGDVAHRQLALDAGVDEIDGTTHHGGRRVIGRDTATGGHPGAGEGVQDGLGQPLGQVPGGTGPAMVRRSHSTARDTACTVSFQRRPRPGSIGRSPVNRSTRFSMTGDLDRYPLDVVHVSNRHIRPRYRPTGRSPPGPPAGAPVCPEGRRLSSRPSRTIIAPANNWTTSITSGATLLSALVEYLSRETPLRPACCAPPGTGSPCGCWSPPAGSRDTWHEASSVRYAWVRRHRHGPSWSRRVRRTRAVAVAGHRRDQLRAASGVAVSAALPTSALPPGHRSPGRAVLCCRWRQRGRPGQPSPCSVARLVRYV